MRKGWMKYLIVLTPGFLGLQGCHVGSVSFTGSAACTVNGPNAGDCTVTAGGVVNILPGAKAQYVSANDMAATTDGSYVLSVSAPSTQFTTSAGDVAVTTITANTDTGYSSTITLPLTPVNPVVSPANSGDAVYSYNLPSSPQLAAWTQQVTANTSASMDITSTATVPLRSTGTAGSPTLTSTVTSNSIGTVNAGNINFTTMTSGPIKGVPCGQPGGLCKQNPS